MDRIYIINRLIDLYGYKKYLEVGCGNDVSFNGVNAEIKVGVDPVKGGTLRMTSDDYFRQCRESFDVIFIDGLHQNEQVWRDIMHAMIYLKTGGIIVLHDCIPHNEIMQKVPREQEEWTGDVWKAVADATLITKKVTVVDCDYGVGIIHDKDITFDKYTQRKFQNEHWNKWDKVKHEYWDIITPEEFDNRYSSGY